MKKETGARFNAGKIRVDLIPPEIIYALAMVYTVGAVKYDARNWEKGLSWTETGGSLFRHYLKFFSGEDIDPDIELPHVFMLLWNAAALVHFFLHPDFYGEFDDRVTYGASRLQESEENLQKLLENLAEKYAEARRGAGLGDDVADVAA